MVQSPATSSRARPGPDSFRPDIQGLRAVAVLGVVLFHAGFPFLPGGYVGVDVFFVVSGFLITGHLMRELAATGRIGLARFYARRARRILPASVVVLVVTVLAALVFVPPLQLRDLLRDAVATSLYVPNFVFAVDGVDYLAESAPSVFRHFWSLAVEEQFYLVRPALLLLAWRGSRCSSVATRARVVGGLIAVVVLVSFGAGVVLTPAAQPIAFFLLPTRAWELGVGALIAVAPAVAGPGGRGVAVPDAARVVLGWLGLGAILAAMLLLGESTPFPGTAAAFPVLGTALVLAAGSEVRGGVGAVLGVRPLQFLGMVSYSLYLVHWPALVLPAAAAGASHVPQLWITLPVVAVCVPVAWVLYRFVEDPLRRWPVLAAARPRRTLLAAGSASLAVVLLASVAFAGAAAAPLATQSSAVDAPLVLSPVGTPFVPSNLSPTLREAKDAIPSLSARGCHRGYGSTDGSPCRFGPDGAPVIALVGDSHAAQWFPGLERWADDAGYALETYTKSACPAADVTALRDGSPYVACTEWRAKVIGRLQADPPALVLLASYGGASIADPGDFGSAWTAGLRRTIDALGGGGAVAVITDSPNLGETPAVCLSAHLDSADACGRPLAEALAAPARAAEQAAVTGSTATMIDLTGYLCSENTCPPIIGSTLVYRDAHHLTPTMSRRLAPLLGQGVLDALE
ncbi:acyltransferase [Clavibacter michiganensis]|uniref:acyltransferase family protein n=1 Tax=Clavibacter michiganensis TaxID=28447 RepID=UPI000CE87565|nr:acyltransferase family protein [Clavibacter michiganensis]PPF53913.1 acyltransferase [Clavibacter michiganensis]